ncbi:reverse transcriptase domain-containing protein [Dolichospermum flos-aquae]|uniref:RNA-directed DNA polymerase n=1 Tax=Dolichospermum flos-aquae CCAP 1403/13F TaxID=315271 RepID=A0A6H2BWV1_DOLFA|nr:reverse transcriptase domain-containing protein [Dolichospermum flos-aquae]QJB43707.1 AAA domain-containing protein [Dolichospermum flos-aquae CCAP 1403/13F]
MNLKDLYCLSPELVAEKLGVNYHSLIELLEQVDEIYREFKIPKKSGDVRTIRTPISSSERYKIYEGEGYFPLLDIQKKLSKEILQPVYQPKPCVHGFTAKKSIVTNAKAHTKKKYVLNLDIQDFFASINFERVRAMFMAQPYNANDKVANLLAKICCYKDQLPQGAPTSPIVSNMVCAKMDRQLLELAKKHKATYTRYADDVTFSTNLEEFPEALGYVINDGSVRKFVVGEELREIINSNNFEVNERKVRLQTQNYRQEVTGLTVNHRPNVNRKFVRQIRALLHAWQKFGIEKAADEYSSRYDKKYKYLKIRSSENTKRFHHVVRGKIEFLGMVRGKNDPIYKKYLSQYKRLIYEELAQEPKLSFVLKTKGGKERVSLNYQDWNANIRARGLLLPNYIKTSYLLSVLTSLYAGQIILLNGSVGVGKTSLVEKSATILNGNSKIIPVRPAWIDSSDLLGFYNPVNDSFNPSSFLTALQQAQEKFEQFFLVCLDELNLARIENYAADLLSSLEYSKSGQGAQKLILYSPSIEVQIRQEIKLLQSQKSKTSEQSNRLAKLQNFLNTYPAEFSIPKNLILVGTLNSDETTYNISPKVIDRSFVITYPLPDFAEDTNATPSSNPIAKTYIPSLFKELDNKILQADNSNDEFNDSWYTISNWNSLYLSQCGIPLGYRVKRDYKVFYAASRIIELTAQECIGYFLFTKLLPRISFFKDEERENICLEWLEEIENNYSHFGTPDVIENLRNQIHDTRRRNVSYWG